MITIVAVDDSKPYLSTLQSKFEPYKDKYNLAYCFNIFEDEDNIDFMLQKMGKIEPDVVLMDLSFVHANRPSDYGIELVRRILNKYPRQKIIMLVGDDDASNEERWNNIQRSFAAGAYGYLSKESIRNWRAAILDVVEGESYVNDRAMKAILNGLRMSIEPGYQLTPRQREVLVHLAADKTIQQTADSMTGADNKTLAVHTVNFHLRNVKGRLNCKTLHGLIAKAIRNKIIE